MSDDRVNVPRVQLQEWSRVLAILGQDEHFGRNARDQLTTIADAIHYWSTQRTDVGGVRVTQTMGDVGSGSTVVGYVSEPRRPRPPRAPQRPDRETQED
jgi:hypothetical protein